MSPKSWCARPRPCTAPPWWSAAPARRRRARAWLANDTDGETRSGVWQSYAAALGAAALAAVLNVAASDFFFVPPRFSFAGSDGQYLVTFVLLLALGLLTGQLTAGLRLSARIAARRERRAQALFDLTRQLSAALRTRQVEIGQAAVQRLFTEAHRGQISAANAPDGGAEFTVTLPRRPAPELS